MAFKWWSQDLSPGNQARKPRILNPATQSHLFVSLTSNIPGRIPYPVKVHPRSFVVKSFVLLVLAKLPPIFGKSKGMWK